MFVSTAILLWLAQGPAHWMDALKPHRVTIQSVEYREKKAVRVTATDSNDGELLALVAGGEFHDGVIEADIAGKPATTAGSGARGFVGIAFRVAKDPNHYECFYLRPTNGRADDQVRRNHSAQYISHPEFTWDRLRKESTEKYESYVDLVPGEWTHVRIMVKGSRAQRFVRGFPAIAHRERSEAR
jgi:hypothetical protein